jgi:cbb3-type cytochrome oxidase subunit 3
MSQLLHGAESEMGWLMGWTTVLFFSSMVGWTLWAFSPSRREAMDEASRMPLDGGDL